MARPRKQPSAQPSTEPDAQPGIEPGNESGQSTPRRKRTLSDVAEIALLNPGLYRETLIVFRVGANGDDDGAHMVGEMPLEDIVDGYRWLAAELGPGTYRVELRSQHGATVAARATVRVAAPSPAVEALP